MFVAERPARTSLQVMRDVIMALLIREVKTRFGGYRLGFAWAILEPMAHVALFCVIFGVRGREGFGGVDAPIFILTGVMPFLLFQSIFTRVKSANSANRSLYHYRFVKPITSFIARFILEIGVFFFTFIVILLIFMWLGFDSHIHDILMAFLVCMILALFSFSFAICCAVLIEYFPETDRVLGILMKPMLFISCVFYSLEMIPQEYRHFIDWNPVLHAIELFRTYYIEGFDTVGGSLSYLSFFCIVFTFLALRLYRTHWTKMIAS